MPVCTAMQVRQVFSVSPNVNFQWRLQDSPCADRILFGTGMLLLCTGYLMSGLGTLAQLVLSTAVLTSAGWAYFKALQHDWALPHLGFFMAVLFMWTAHAAALYGLAQGIDAFSEMNTVDSKRYYAVYLPMLGAFGVGLALSGSGSGTPEWNRLTPYLQTNTSATLMLMAGGVFSWLTLPYWPPGLRLLPALGVWSLLSVAPLYLMYTGSWRAWAACLGLVVVMVVYSIENTVFGGALFALWMLACGYFLKNNTPLAWRAGVWVAAALMMAALLSFKFEYREAVLTDTSTTGRLQQFARVAATRLSNPLHNPGWHRALLRLDQGHISGKVLAQVPAHTPFVHGETIWTAVRCIFIPRLIDPDKPKAGGAVIYPRFTGETLTPGVSKNIGQFAEAYVNFGPYGGIVCILLYGLLIRQSYEGLRQLQHVYPPVLLWLPFLFFRMLSVETDFLTTLNHLAKGSIFVLVTAWVLLQFSRNATK